DCEGYLIRIKHLYGDLSYVALIQEIRSELSKGKQKGKKVYVYLDGYATLPSYYLASVSDIVVMPPMGAISQLGIQFELLKFEDAMKKFGIGYQFIQSGKYKVATSPLSPKLSLSQRLTIKNSLENIMSQVKNDIQVSRLDPIDSSIYDGRIISAENAKRLGLIDEIAFWADMKDIIRDDIKNDSDLVLTSLGAFEDDQPIDYLWSSFNKIAIVEINGPIQSGRNQAGVIFGGVNTGADEISAIFEGLKRDPFLQGVILRVNSPGGSIIASDQILNAIQDFKEMTQKPVYASMGNIAASGGYYVAMGSDQIFANASTITGSIGVVTGFFNFSEFEKTWGISSETLSTGKYMDAFSPHQPISNDALAMFQSFQHESFTHFKSLVQSSRDLTDDEVNAIAQGQFMTGEEAHSVGLVDTIGSYSDAVKAMEDDLGLKSSRVVILGRPKQVNPFGFLQFLFN
ncbi:MAG: signal peptide peptidase SppA, partial [Candidatus Margulisiibacteriota bacterium]